MDTTGMVAGLHRFQQTGHSHFITFSCYDRRPLLESDFVRTRFLITLEQLRSAHVFDVIGYVLMPEHVHLLFTEPELHPLSKTIQVLKQTVSRECAREVDASAGCFWQRRYYDFNVRSEDKRIEKLRYIHRNPVTRGLVMNPGDWKWSSYRAYRFGEEGLVKVASEWANRWRPDAMVEARLV